ncbi:structural protein P5 [Photobacterium kishitanii]|nr:hypothetical protein AYY22_20985 [Photobacterium kishitanii]PSW68712.1 structural protein P5 [Photobacterium kishitanii]
MAVALAAAVIGGVGYHSLGLRNNNPMNIVYNQANNWVGQKGRNGRFATFKTEKYGIRAGAILLHNYMYRYGLRSVGSVIGRFAPTNENNTGKYSKFVANEMGVSEWGYRLGDNDLVPLIRAIIHYENGSCPFSVAFVSGVVRNAI